MAISKIYPPSGPSPITLTASGGVLKYECNPPAGGFPNPISILNDVQIVIRPDFYDPNNMADFVESGFRFTIKVLNSGNIIREKRKKLILTRQVPHSLSIKPKFLFENANKIEFYLEGTSATVFDYNLTFYVYRTGFGGNPPIAGNSIYLEWLE